MTANARNMKPAPSSLPTPHDVEAGRVTLDDYEIAHGEDIPEATAADFARARPISDFPELLAALKDGQQKRRPRPVEVHVSPPTAVHFEAKSLRVELEDGRTLSVPLTWYPDLVTATPAQRSAFVLTRDSVLWPQFGEEASIASILRTQIKIAELQRARGQRGAQKAPTKDRVGMRLDHHVVEHFRSTGPGWQGRINAVLADYVKRNER